MKKTQIFTIATLACIFLMGFPSSSSAAQIAFVATDQELAGMETQLKILQIQLYKLLGTEAEGNSKQNLSIGSLKLLRPEIDGSAAEVENQRISIFVKNNKYGGEGLSRDRFEYSVELYEIVNEKRQKLGHTIVGYTLLPSGEFSSQFFATIDSDRYLTKGDRTFEAKVKIDSARTIRESNENDNDGWTEQWTITN